MIETNISWIGQIPTSWDLKRIKNCDAFKTGKDYKHLKSGKIPVYGSSETPFEYVDKSICNKKSIVVGRKGTIDQPFITPEKFWAVDTCLYNTVSNKNWNFKYVFYWIKIIPFKEIGTKTAVPSLTQTQVNNLPIAYPSLIQQEKIANYLDTETSKIDRKISILEQKFNKLEEYKQSVVLETVTKGLDNNVVMKDSNIDWIGNIPAHWEIKRLKTQSKIRTGFPYSMEYGSLIQHEGYLPLIKMSNFKKSDNSLKLLENQLYFDRKISFSAVLKKNEFIMGLSGSVENMYWHNTEDEWIVNQRIAIFYQTSRFIWFVLQCKNAINFLIDDTQGTAQINISHLDILKLPIPVPSKNEQDLIVNYLDNLCLTIDKKKEIIKKQIELLKEYRQTIIYESVTGKMEIL